jgi:hypothetical protein
LLSIRDQASPSYRTARKIRIMYTYLILIIVDTKLENERFLTQYKRYTLSLICFNLFTNAILICYDFSKIYFSAKAYRTVKLTLTHSALLLTHIAPKEWHSHTYFYMCRSRHK